VKKLLKSEYIYGSYRKIKTGLSLFGPPGMCTSKAALCAPRMQLPAVYATREPLLDVLR